MDPDEPLSTPIIKRRNLKGVRPSSSSSSLRSWSAQLDGGTTEAISSSTPSSTPGPVTPSTKNGTPNEGDDSVDDGGAVVFRRTKNKKTPAGRAGVLGASTATSGSGSTTKPKIKSRLSVGLSLHDEDEMDEGDSFVVTKRASSSSSSTPARKLLSLRDYDNNNNGASLPSNLDQADISPHKSALSTVYSTEYLDELKRGTLSTPPPPPPAAPVAMASTTGHDDLTMSKFASHFAASEGGSICARVKRRGSIVVSSLTKSAPNLHRLNPLVADAPVSHIPTTAAIASAKARRERIRTEGGGIGSDGFIALEVGPSRKAGSGSESRLVREDDDLGDGMDEMADFESSLPLGKKANRDAKREEKQGMMRSIDEAEEEMEDGEDEETKEWEERQMARANEKRAREEMQTLGQATYVPTPIPQTSTLPTLTNVQARLSAGLNTLESSRTLDVAALNHSGKERTELDAQENELRSEVMRIEEKHRWFNDFKTFIEDVAAFLDEKFPALEKIEKENLAIQKERYEIVSRRRFEDDSDDVALFTGMSVPSAFSLDPKVSEEEEEGQHGGEDEVDEMGRSTRRTEDRFGPRSGARVARRSARERRLDARRSAHQPNGVASTAEDDAAMWTDDDLGSADSADLADALSSLQELRRALFEDVRVDDFRDPNLGIRKKFEEWKTTYREDYENAFGGLALVGVWEFWARVEMALWNPFGIDQLAKTPSGLDSYHWHSSLTAFGHASHTYHIDDEDDDNHMDEDGAHSDESAEVVNALVTSVVIPRLIALARASYDPWSRKQTIKALALVDEVSYCVETTSPRFDSLIQAFLSRLQIGIIQSSTLILPHLTQLNLPSNAFDPSTFIARERFLLRQLKLLQNAQKWRRYARSHRLPLSTSSSIDPISETGSGATLDELLQRDLVAKVMLPVIEASWTTGGEDIARKVLGVLPSGEWIPALRRRLEGERR
ncbi:BQ2448_6140 [Microbotryum intermedium]|uniref:BQ2448_6140 protein n=1 Tax=Microbotryum intermedium TaxID=269621 RepID=A0A238FIU6_9BASI|nr:BQ2448_6140 [Microbotryum intermedium]